MLKVRLCLLAWVGALGVWASASTPYVDPGGAFAIQLPSNWTAERTQLEEGLFYTEATRKDLEQGPHVDVMIQELDIAIPSAQHAEVNQAMAQAVKQLLSSEGSIVRESAKPSTFDQRTALRTDLDYKDSEGNLQRGALVTVCGPKRVFAILIYAPANDAKMLAEAESVAQTLALESRTPRSASGVQSGSSMLDKASLNRLAGSFKSNLKRKSENDVLVPGDPPLTYGSVANFVNVIEILFDIQLTEVEFNATLERFIEYYNKQDAEGKRILAQQGAQLLRSLTTGTAAEREQSRQEGRAVFENAFQRGAEMGIGYAEVMWKAITRRKTELAETKAKPKREDWDQEITEGDLDATLEMLYFMWVAAGRDASDVTAEDVEKVRQMIIDALPTMDPQLQLVIANAPRIYAGLRQDWMKASPQRRLDLAQVFGACLDEWGIGAQSSFESTGTSSGGGESLNAQIAQNTAWNAAKTWSTTTSP